MPSSEAAGIVKDRVFDLVFIDGTHSYDQTKLDIELWLPKVVGGGILCGHDCEARIDGFDKDYLWKNRHCDTIEVIGSIPVIHPGVILAVSEKSDASVHLWAEELIRLKDATFGRSTIWDFTVTTTK